MMSIHSLNDRRERNRAAADAAFAEIEREVAEARDAIMARALRTISTADPQATVSPIIDRLGAIWCDAWPFGREGAR